MPAGHVCIGSEDPIAGVTGSRITVPDGYLDFSLTYADLLAKRGDTLTQAVMFSARWLWQQSLPDAICHTSTHPSGASRNQEALGWNLSTRRGLTIIVSEMAKYCV